MALIDKASLLFVPSVVAEGKAFNILPSGNRAPDSTDQNSGYDQTRADFTFDRGSNAAATRIGSDGLIKKYRENFVTHSNDFSNASYVKVNASLSKNATDYLGVANNAWTFSKNAANGQFYKQVTYSGVNTFSLYAKSGSLNWMRLYVDGGGGEAFFDLQNGVIGTQSYNNIDAQIESVGNDWYRCSVSCTSVTYVNAYPADSDGVISGTSGSILISFNQVEKGLVATDYLESTSVTGKAGVLVDLPRINYDANGENGALLLEPSRQNLITHSEALSIGTSGSSVEQNTSETTSPEGVYNATKVLGSTSYLAKGVASAFSGNNTTSIFLKKGNDSTIGVYMYDGAYYRANFNLESGTIDAEVNATATIEDYGNGWYRCSIYKQTPANVVEIGIDGVVGYCYTYGWQHEYNASYATSYIPTMGTSETRAGDYCYKSGLGDVIGQTEGTLFFDWVMNHESPNISEDLYTLTLSDGTGNKMIAIFNYNNTLGVFIKDTTTQFLDSSYTGGADGVRIKLALAYANNDVALYINGSLIATSSSATIPALNEIRMNTFWNGNLPDSSSVKQLALFNERLSNAELAALTA